MELSEILKAVPDGATVHLPEGDLGDLVLSRPLRLVGGPGSVFRSLRLTPPASGSRLEGFAVHLRPTLATSSASFALQLAGLPDRPVRDVTIAGLDLRCGIAPAGDGKRGSSNVAGQPIGHCLGIRRAQDVKVEQITCATAYKGVVLDEVRRVRIARSDIDGMRGSPIVGADVGELAIVDNLLRGSTPWGWGDASKDHGDYIHLWTTAEQAGPSEGIEILNNLLDQGRGTPILGIYLDDNALGRGFSRVRIAGNVVRNGNNQGVRTECLWDGVIEDNVFVPTPGTPEKRSPKIILAARPAGEQLVIRRNVGAASDTFREFPGNTILPPVAIQSLVAV